VQILRIGEVEFRCASGSHDGVEDTELTGGERTDHDATRAEAGEAQLGGADFAGDAAEASHDGTFTTSALLVDEGEKSIGGVGDDSGGNTGNHTRGERDGHLLSFSAGLGVGAGGRVDLLGGPTLDSELSHGIRDLLEEDGEESGVEALDDTVVADDLGERGDETAGVGGVGNQSDAGGLTGAEEDISDELGTGGSGQVDREAKVPGALNANGLGHVDLEELNASEFEESLDEVSDGGGTETGSEGSNTLLGDDLAESADHTLVVLDGVELNAGLHDINGAQGTVGHRAADSSGQTTLERVGEVEGSLLVGGGHESGALGERGDGGGGLGHEGGGGIAVDGALQVGQRGEHGYY